MKKIRTAVTVLIVLQVALILLCVYLILTKQASWTMYASIVVNIVSMVLNLKTRKSTYR